MRSAGVERLAREMAVRLPELRPDRYRLIEPPPWLAHRAGHVWEQLVLPAPGRAVEADLLPGQPGPAGHHVAAWS